MDETSSSDVTKSAVIFPSMHLKSSYKATPSHELRALIYLTSAGGPSSATRSTHLLSWEHCRAPSA